MNPLAKGAKISSHWENAYIRYLAAGAFNTGLSFATYSAGIVLGLAYLTANVIAWAVSVVVAFLLASQFVFRMPVTLRRFPAFVLSNVFSLIVSTAMISVFVRIFAMNEILSSAVTVPIVVALNFLALKFVVFRLAGVQPR